MTYPLHVPAQAKIGKLYKGSQLNLTITENTENDVEYIWPIPASQDTSTNYQIKITSTSDDAIFDWSDSTFSILEDTGIESEKQLSLTNQLYGNYPNPFNPETTIRYQIAKTVTVSITVYNILGEKVRTLLNITVSPGQHEIQWHGKNEQG